MTKRFLWLLAGLAVIGFMVTSVQAETFRYDIEATSAGGTQSASVVISPDRKTVSVAAGWGSSTGQYILMSIYASIQNDDGDPTNDGFNGGALNILNSSSGVTGKVVGNLAAISSNILVSTGTSVNGSVNVGFKGANSYNGAGQDFQGDGDNDWGETGTSVTTKVLQPSVGTSPVDGEMIMGSTSVDGRTKILIGQIRFNSKSVSGVPVAAALGQVTTIHAQSFPSSNITTYYNKDALLEPILDPDSGDVIGYRCPNFTSVSGDSPAIGAGQDVVIQAPPIPEPATLALLGMGGLALLPVWWRRRRAS